MHSFEHLLNWKLKKGSHRFPGPDGGTCINEAAVIAAGFPYQSVRQIETMPACFSRPICRLAMWLNDEATDEERQRLLPFVTRLACADTREVEQQRAAHINQALGWSEREAFSLAVNVVPSGGVVIAAERVTWSFDQGLEVLEGALAIGRQAEPFPAHEVQTRLEAVRGKAKASGPASAAPLLAKVKHWLLAKETA
jgi:hypothetical protein